MSDCCEAGKNDGEGALPCRCSKNGGASHRTFNEQDQRGKFRLNRCGHVKVPVNEVGALFHAVSLSAPSQVAVDQNLVATDSNRCKGAFTGLSKKPLPRPSDPQNGAGDPTISTGPGPS